MGIYTIIKILKKIAENLYFLTVINLIFKIYYFKILNFNNILSDNNIMKIKFYKPISNNLNFNVKKVFPQNVGK